MTIDVDARVSSNLRLSSDYNVVRLDAPALAETARPGQFVMIKASAGLKPLLRRPFSIFEILTTADSSPAGFSLLNKRVGVGTTLLFDVKPQTRIACLGPLGRPFTLVDPPREAWMVAGGVGLAPFLMLARALRARGTAVSLFYGGRSADDLFFLDAFEQLGVTLVVTTEDGSRGERGLVTAPLHRALAARGERPASHRDPAEPKPRSPRARREEGEYREYSTHRGQRPTPPRAGGLGGRMQQDVHPGLLNAATAALPPMLYVCGPTPMMRAVATIGATHACPSEVSLEPMMGCGMGGCYSCVVSVRDDHDASPHFVRACMEGPIFAGDRLVWREPANTT